MAGEESQCPLQEQKRDGDERLRYLTIAGITNVPTHRLLCLPRPLPSQEIPPDVRDRSVSACLQESNESLEGIYSIKYSANRKE